MKICYAHTGTNIQDHIFIKFLIRRGHEVHLVTFYDVKKEPPNMYGLPDLDGLIIHHVNTEKIRSPSKLVDFFFQFPLNTLIMKKILRETKPDILNGHWIQTYGFYSAMSNFHPFLLNVWGSDILITPRLSRFARFVSRHVVSSADAVVINNISQEEALLKLGCEKEKILRFPWGVDLDKFNPKVSGKDLRKRLGWEKNLIVFFGRWHEPVYGIEHLMNAIPLILKKNLNVRFIIAGTGSLTPGFKSFVRKNRLESKVKFMGRIAWEEMPKYISASDIYVSPSLSDGSSVTMLEAMACGKAVAVSDIPGNREWIDEGKNGLLFSVKDPNAIAEKVIELADNPSLSRKISKNALSVVKKGADLNKNLLLYEKLMKDLIKRD